LTYSFLHFQQSLLNLCRCCCCCAFLCTWGHGGVMLLIPFSVSLCLLCLFSLLIVSTRLLVLLVPKQGAANAKHTRRSISSFTKSISSVSAGYRHVRSNPWIGNYRAKANINCLCCPRPERDSTTQTIGSLIVASFVLVHHLTTFASDGVAVFLEWNHALLLHKRLVHGVLDSTLRRGQLLSFHHPAIPLWILH
jgi:hypothetical protein